ncbi:MAG: hypothetical protein HY421_01220 [Candidatus Kerfeldbacteria bacterium]|nr:hypothetical protein [Candidatus Kerfeldbacteria bacterium]
MSCQDQSLVRDVADAIARLTGRDAHSITATTSLDDVLPMAIMRIAVLRQLERRGQVEALVDGDIRAWLTAARGWSTVASLVAVVENHRPTTG